MSYFAALQSAAFYVLACTPYHQMRSQYTEKKKAKRDLELRKKATTVTAYAHPLPQHTNVYWTEEIMMGPRLNKKTSTRSYHVPDRDGTTGLCATPSRSDYSVSDGPTLVGETPVDENWNKKRYQRADEELWGLELLGKVGEALSSAGRKLEATIVGRESHNNNNTNSPLSPTDDYERNYQLPTIPPVNEFHPPIVTNYTSLPRSSHQWMLQPPPPAKFMEGRVPVSRTPSAAGSCWAPPSRKASYVTAPGSAPNTFSSAPPAISESVLTSIDSDTDFDSDAETDVEMVREYNTYSMKALRAQRARSFRKTAAQQKGQNQVAEPKQALHSNSLSRSGSTRKIHTSSGVVRRDSVGRGRARSVTSPTSANVLPASPLHSRPSLRRPPILPRSSLFPESQQSGSDAEDEADWAQQKKYPQQKQRASVSTHVSMMTIDTPPAPLPVMAMSVRV